MDCKELKNYTNRAKELEAAIYTQEKLMAEHKRIIDEAVPCHPSKKEVSPPVKPNYAFFKYREPRNEEAGWGLIMMMLIILGVIILSFVFITLDEISTFSSFVLAVLGGAVIVSGPIVLMSYNRKKKIKTDELETRYKQSLENYEKAMQIYLAEADKETAKYNAEVQAYQTLLSKHTAASSEVMQQHESVLLSLKNALEAHYAQNVIFPKYRNFVAITSISEYLMSGRCDRLEGANGAYNLYEMELRQNIIIGQLSAVIDNLEQIRNDQYSLYQELCKTNELVTSIAYDLRELNDNSKLTAYYSYVSALAAVSPTYSFGIVY